MIRAPLANGISPMRGMLFGLWMIVDGIFFVIAGHSPPPFDQPS